MIRRLCCISILLFFVFSLFACHAVPPESGVTPPATTPSTIPASEPTTIPTTVPTEPTMPKELVSQRLDHMWFYWPAALIYPYSGYLIRIVPALDPALYPGMEITFDLSVNYGKIWDSRNAEHWDWAYSELSIPNKVGSLRWQISSTNDYEPIPEGEAVFVEAIVRADGHIVGYGIIEIGSDHRDSVTYCAMMRTEGVCFPMIDGELQNVSEEYVADRIAELKQTVTPFDLEAKRAENRKWNEEELDWWNEWLTKMTS